MPIKPKPRLFRCKECGWQTIVKPTSDALMPNEHYFECPTCHNPHLEDWVPTLTDTVFYYLSKVL